MREVVDLSRAEVDTITSWSTPPGWKAGEAHPGQGRFLIKAGQRAGIPVQLQLTNAERNAGGLNTNRRWNLDKTVLHGPVG
ncbi:hypothetical protein [Motilibacter deserti]|uniref:Uncharacterized protein n=1 Tax=Motilibacter deserti TaxID=2714956 RepID=A0ABX0GYZ7_9ACTN|nr:hypothetical protein [Motilibacter deserti]NHC15818.1 hypothetical protein [Motilibacter deserti]